MRDWTFLVVCTLCLALGWGASPTVAQDYYGAIAFSPSTRAHGWAYDYATRQQAESRAVSECRRHAGDCIVAVWFRNACAALAVGREGYGSDWGTSERLAESGALRTCSRHTDSCSILRSICTTRS